MKKIELYFRATLFSLGMIIATMIHATLSLFTFFLPWKIRYQFITLWSRFIIFWLKSICNIDYQVEGLENLPKNRNAIILSKHQSTWETLAFQIIFPPQTWVLKKELLNVPFFGWALRLLEPIAINRRDKKSALEQMIQQGKEKLMKGRWIVVFPEGTRCAPGKNRPFTKGGAVLAEQSQFPVIPVTHNAGLFWPRRGFIKKPGTIIVKIGPLIETAQLSAKEINHRAKQWIDEASKYFYGETTNTL